jgi:hypothetical protein
VNFEPQISAGEDSASRESGFHNILKRGASRFREHGISEGLIDSWIGKFRRAKRRRGTRSRRLARSRRRWRHFVTLGSGLNKCIRTLFRRLKKIGSLGKLFHLEFSFPRKSAGRLKFACTIDASRLPRLGGKENAEANPSAVRDLRHSEVEEA